jgi:hypothetical protein
MTMSEHDDSLGPHQPGDMEPWEHIPQGKPEEFGFPQDSATHQKVQVWQRQEAVLAAYRECGKIGKAANAVGLTRWVVDWWLKHDIFQFNRRIEAAHADYCEKWEQGMDARLENPQGNRGSDILYMFKMKAEKPEKYREDVKVQGLEPITQLLEEARKLAARDIERRKQLEEGAAEGEYRDLGENEQN